MTVAFGELALSKALSLVEKKREPGRKNSRRIVDE